jgi:hypothetical protein
MATKPSSLVAIVKLKSIQNNLVPDFIVLDIAAIQDTIVLFKILLSRNNDNNLPARFAFRRSADLMYG